MDGGINTYGYATGNPLAKIDPEGLQAIVCIPPVCFPLPIPMPGSGGYGEPHGGGKWGALGGSDSWGGSKTCPSPDPEKDPCKGLRDQLKAHEKKLKDYSDNPPQHDNLGLLGQGYDHFIIPWRKRSLQKQIDNFRKQLEECEAKHGKGR